MVAHMQFCCALVAAACAAAALPQGFHPVVVAGPLLNQNLDVWNKNFLSLCHNSDWEWLYGNPDIMSGPQLICIADGIGLGGWDAYQKSAVAKPGIEVRPHGGFGGGFPSIDPVWKNGYLDGNPAFLLPKLRAHGYVENITVVGHGYDFRLSVNDWQRSSFLALRSLIESATFAATGTPAVLTGISMASPYLHAFLSWVRTQDPEWVTRHIHAWVPVAGPFNGAVISLAAALTPGASASGTVSATEGECPRCNPPEPPAPMSTPPKSTLLKLVDGVVEQVYASWPVAYWVSNKVDYSTTPPRDPEVVTLTMNGSGTTTYRASQLPSLLKEFGHDQLGNEMMEYALSVGTTADPGVPVHCVFSHNVKTVSHLTYEANASGFQQMSRATFDDGDDEVNLESLEVCTRWKSTVKVYRIPGVKHAAMLGVGQVIDVIVAVATNDEEAWQRWVEPKYSELVVASNDTKAPLEDLFDATNVTLSQQEAVQFV